MKKFVVVGASAASISFISKLRSFDLTSEIICLTLEPDFPYNRCFLADYLTGEKTDQQLALKAASFFNQQSIQMHYQAMVIQFDFDHKRVLYRQNEQEHWVDYDILFLGMGASSFVPDIIAKQWCQGMFQFHTLEDMRDILSFIQQKKVESAVVLGAGINGIEAASALREKGIAVTLVEQQEQILASQLSVDAAAWVEKIVSWAGIVVRKGVACTQFISKNGFIDSIILADGLVLRADLVIVATGSIVNSKYLKNTAIQMYQNSVVVNQFLKTNIQDVFAAGDLCAVRGLHNQNYQRSTTWSDAMLQGLCAATNFSAQPRLYAGVVNLRDSYFCGLDFYACGQTIGHDQSVQVIQKALTDSFMQLFVQDGCLLGFVLIGDISQLAQLKQLYMTRSCITNIQF